MSFIKIVISILILFLLGYIAVQAQTSYLNVFWKPKVFMTPPSVTPASFVTGVSPNIVVSISLTDTINKVLPTQFGVNSNFRSGSSIISRIPLYTQANFGQFRFPAGSGSNTYFWDGVAPTDISNMTTNPILGTAGSNFTPTLFAQFLNSTNAQANIVVNYFYARYGKTAVNSQAGATVAQIRNARVQQAADYAAGFVRKMNIDLKAKVLNWEVGNECYGNWEQGYNVTGLGNVTGTEYGQDFKVFAAAMKAVDPTIKIGAVVWPSNSTWSSQVLAQVKDVADFLIVHEYFTGEAEATPANILANVADIKADMDTINNWVVKYANKPKNYFPVALTEFNSRGYSSATMLNGLFFSSILGEVIKNGYGFSTSWVNEWGISNNATMGLISNSDDPDQPAYTPRPAYMPYYFYGKYFGDYMVKSSATGSGVNVYSSVFSGGEAGLVIINTNDTDQYIKINTNSSKFNNRMAYWHEFNATDINSGNKKFYINGQTNTTIGGGPLNYTSIPPFQAVFTNNSIIQIKKFSVIYINLSFNLSADVPTVDTNSKSSFKITPNPAVDFLNINQQTEQTARVEISDLTGKLLYINTAALNTISIPTSKIGKKGIYMVKVNSEVKKLIIK